MSMRGISTLYRHLLVIMLIVVGVSKETLASEHDAMASSIFDSVSSVSDRMADLMSYLRQLMLRAHSSHEDLGTTVFIPKSNNKPRKQIPVLEPFTLNETIFIVDTRANLTKFGLKLLCSIISIATSNPDNRVAVLAASRKAVLNIPSYLYNYHNVRVRTIDLDDFFASTSLDAIWKGHSKGKDPHSLPSVSDMLRLALLERYGGSSVDHDVIGLRAMVEKPATFVIPEDEVHVGSSIFRFTKGHPVLRSALTTMVEEYRRGGSLSSISSLLTAATLKYCSASGDGTSLRKLKCPDDLKLLPTAAGYPVPLGNFRSLYGSSGKRIARDMIVNKTGTFMVNYYASRLSELKKSGQISDDLLIKDGSVVIALMFNQCYLPYKMEAKYNLGVSWTSPIV